MYGYALFSEFELLKGQFCSIGPPYMKSDNIMMIIINSYTLHKLQACSSQSELMLLAIRKSNLCALYLYNYTQDNLCTTHIVLSCA